MSTYLVILGEPPGRALFNVKSRTLRVLTTAFFVDGVNIVTMAIPLSLSLSLFIEKDTRTYTNSKTRYELRKELTSGYSHTSPHTWSLQNFKCMEFKSPFVVVLHQGISRCCSRCSSHVRRCCLSVILLDLPIEMLGPKIPEGKLYPRTCSCFLLKGK